LLHPRGKKILEGRRKILPERSHWDYWQFITKQASKLKFETVLKANLF
jgi:hypothetical protein